MSDVIVLSDDEEDAPSLAQRLLQRSGLATSTLSALSQADVQQPKLGAAARTGAAKSGKNTKAPAKRKLGALGNDAPDMAAKKQVSLSFEADQRQRHCDKRATRC